MKEKIEKKLYQDNLKFNCEICQDAPGGCQNCQGEYYGDDDPELREHRKRMLEASANEFEEKQQVDDGLSFICEYCQDAPGGCPQCGFGAKQHRVMDK